MLGNLAQSLFWEEKLTTTVTRAKAVRPLAERLITKARRGDLHARRQVLKVIGDTEVVTKLFDEIAPRYADRPGGYTRIVKIGPRRGDSAEMAIIELV
ncbi:50S ribosomal protein L17 [bacterium BMS3Abin02]|nr:50S ribosomal protein L17 [bacterium BMS3Abin02]GBE21282.1 50S ribosomal protein L17 [bacterium BMS3Bbin01]